MSAGRVDGRRLRAERTRAAIVDAVLALVEEGDLKPTAPRVAARAAVSLRTVYQHFAELEALFVAMSERQVERVAAMAAPVRPDLPLASRVDVYARQRCRILELVTPFARAMQHLGPTSALVRAEARRLRDLGSAEVAAAFRPELERLGPDERLLLRSALVASSTWRAWEGLRADQDLDPARAEAVVRFQLGAALAAAGFPVAVPHAPGRLVP